jgi:spore photoproduct lyase
MEHKPDRILISEQALHDYLGQEVLSRSALRNIPVHLYPTDDCINLLPKSELRGAILVTRRPSGGWVKTAVHGELSVRDFQYYINPVIGCQYGCDYCYLKGEQFDKYPLRYHTDIDNLISEIDEIILLNNSKCLFCSGELADSLAEEELFPVTSQIVKHFATCDSATFEIRTKSSSVNGLLTLEHNSRTTISFSIMPDKFSLMYEHGLPVVHARILAAKKCYDCGYRVAFNLEPLLMEDGYLELYDDMFKILYNVFGGSSVAHFSIGCLRWSISLDKNDLFMRKMNIYRQMSEVVEYRPGAFHHMIHHETRVNTYDKIIKLIRSCGFNTTIWLSMETPSVVGQIGHCISL